MKFKNSLRDLTLIIVLVLLTIVPATSAKGNTFLKQQEVLNEKPVVIGIMSQPRSQRNINEFPTDQYILEINREFIESSGMVRAIPIHYDTPEDVLEGILDKIDGVHFTGGGLNLYNFTSQMWHPYYLTAKRIFQYTTRPSGRKFLLTGICQGFEVLTTLAAEDDADLLRVLSRDDV
jgi:hypothetical protein